MTQPIRRLDKPILIIGIIVIVLTLVSVGLSWYQNNQVKELSECTNQVVLEQNAAFKSRDDAMLSWINSSNEVVNARGEVLELLFQDLRGEDASTAVLNDRNERYNRSVEIYDSELKEYIAAIVKAPLITVDQCN
jgi:hypothetical protein